MVPAVICAVIMSASAAMAQAPADSVNAKWIWFDAFGWLR